MAKSTEILAIILPPAHGKSRMHTKLPYLKEADGVIDCKATETLVKLRSKAKETGDWTEYDKEWGRELLSRLEPNDVIMLPSRVLAQSMGVQVIGVFALCTADYSKNMKTRGQNPGKHKECYLAAVNDKEVIHCNNETIVSEIGKCLGKCRTEVGSIDV